MTRATNGAATTTSQLPAELTSMASGLSASAKGAADSAGQQFMKFTKFGAFVFGAENMETEEGALFAVNPMGFGHGWIAWGDKAHGNESQMLGEVSAAAKDPLPAKPNPVAGDWSEQRLIQMACISGEDAGEQMLFKSSSLGGKKFYAALVLEVVKKINAGATDIVPVITLEADSYIHAKYGRIFTPLYTIKRWTTMDTVDPEAGVEEQDAAEPEQAPPKRERRPRAGRG